MYFKLALNLSEGHFYGKTTLWVLLFSSFSVASLVDVNKLTV